MRPSSRIKVAVKKNNNKVMNGIEKFFFLSGMYRKEFIYKVIRCCIKEFTNTFSPAGYLF